MSFAVAFLLTIVPPHILGQAVPGDVDGSGQVDASDVQMVVDVVLDHPDFAAERVNLIRGERERLREALRAMPEVEVFPSETNFLLIRLRRAESVFRSLIQKGVFVRSFIHSPGLEGCLRVTVGAPEENKRFLEALSEALRDASDGS